MATWSDWSRRRGLPLWTTEGWASIGWSPNLVPAWDGWDYIKQVGEAAVGLALQHGWQGICTSNFSQPHHKDLWADINWHRQLTQQISGAPQEDPRAFEPTPTMPVTAMRTGQAWSQPPRNPA